MKSGLYRIICPACKKESLENNEKFDPTIKPNGTMFQKIKGVKMRSPHDALAGVKGQNFQCPMCMMPVCTSGGWVKVREVESGDTLLSKDIKPEEPEVKIETKKPKTKKLIKKSKRKVKSKKK